MPAVPIVSLFRALRTALGVLLLCGMPAVAADLLPLTAAQKANLGIVTSPALAEGTAPALTYPARVTLPPASVQVIATSGAALVTRVHVQAGDAVRRGAALVTLSMPGLAEAHAALAQARSRAELASGNAARDQKLFDEGLIAESRLRASRAEAQASRAGLVAARSTHALLGSGEVRGSSITLTAPRAGVVTESVAEPGLRVDAGTALLKLADVSSLALEIPLSTAQAQQVAVGQEVRVVGSTARGRVSALLPQLTAAQSVLVRAPLADPQKLLRPGQSVQAEILGLRATPGVVVPASALVWKGSTPYVFVEVSQGFVPTPVKLLRQNAREIQIGGVAPGARVAAKGVAALKSQWLGD